MFIVVKSLTCCLDTQYISLVTWVCWWNTEISCDFTGLRENFVLNLPTSCFSLDTVKFNQIRGVLDQPISATFLGKWWSVPEPGPEKSSWGDWLSTRFSGYVMGPQVFLVEFAVVARWSTVTISLQPNVPPSRWLGQRSCRFRTSQMNIMKWPDNGHHGRSTC